MRALPTLAGMAALAAITADVGRAQMLQPQDPTGQNGYSNYCAMSQDPAACEQLLKGMISKGIVAGSRGPEPQGGILQGLAPSVTVTPQPAAAERPSGPGQLEAIYSRRASTALKQFGYDMIGNGGTISALQIGAIQDDYILGQGDAIVVTLRGQENATYTVFVDRDGNVTLPRLRPVSASGRRFGDFRAELDAAIAQGYLQTQAYVTIGQVRQISVNVVGEVTNPGVYALSGLSSVLDALNVSGGIRKSGSLRRIVVVRGNETTAIDLYRFLSPDGGTPRVGLRQGDRIVVAPIGATIAVSGNVRRPGIYELAFGARSLSVRAALDLANGYEIRGAYRLMIVRTNPNGEQEYEDTTGRPGAILRDGEVLVVNPSANYAAGSVTLSGNVRLPGIYALNRVRTLHDLLPDEHAFLQGTYMPFAFIVRQDKKTLTSVVIPFSVLELMQGKFDVELQSQDVVHILNPGAMRQLIALESNPQTAQQQIGQQQIGAQPGAPAAVLARQAAVHCRTLTREAHQLEVCEQPAAGRTSAAGLQQEELAPQLGLSGGNDNIAQQSGSSAPSDGGIEGAQGGIIAGAADQTAQATDIGQPEQSASGEETAGSAVEGLSDAETATIGFMVKDYRVSLEGAVRQPGEYLAAPGATLDEVLRAGDGLEPNADLADVEITSTSIDNVGGQSTSTRKLLSLTPETLSTVELKRLDVVHIPAVNTQIESGDVAVSGEVQFPGTFHILKGEHLSSLLTRAGGLTKDAYPIGAIFQRVSIATVQEQAHQREADDLQKQLMATVARAGNLLASSGGAANAGLSPEAAGFVAEVIAQLRTKPADGRMSVIADPAALAAHPEADIELQPGDRLFVPKRPSEVDVTGEVLNPGSFRFAPELNVADYIKLSGGDDRYADDDRIFVVNPDGTSRRVSDGMFDFQPDKVAPGSVIVVPRDLAPLDLGDLTVSLSKVLSDMAISAASLAVLAKSN